LAAKQQDLPKLVSDTAGSMPVFCMLNQQSTLYHKIRHFKSALMKKETRL